MANRDHLDEFDRAFHELADNADYGGQAQAIQTILDSPRAFGIVGEMELGYFIEKVKESGGFEKEISILEQLLASHPGYEQVSAQDVMEDLYKKEDAHRMAA